MVIATAAGGGPGTTEEGVWGPIEEHRDGGMNSPQMLITSRTYLFNTSTMEPASVRPLPI